MVRVKEMPVKYMTFIMIVAVLLSTPLFADQIKIQTEPIGVEVFVRDLNGAKENKLGKTPFEGNIQEISKSYSSSNFFHGCFKKRRL